MRVFFFILISKSTKRQLVMFFRPPNGKAPPRCSFLSLEQKNQKFQSQLPALSNGRRGKIHKPFIHEAISPSCPECAAAALFFHPSSRFSPEALCKTCFFSKKKNIYIYMIKNNMLISLRSAVTSRNHSISPIAACFECCSHRGRSIVVSSSG